VLVMVAVALAVCLSFIAKADLQGHQGRFVLEGRSSGGELEDERSLPLARSSSLPLSLSHPVCLYPCLCRRWCLCGCVCVYVSVYCRVMG